MYSKFKRNERGFTLIELIVVMIIIGILVLLATPRFIRYIEEAKYTRIVNDIRVVETVSVPYMARNNMELPTGTAKEATDLSEFTREKKAYMKDGLVIEEGEEFTPVVGKLSEYTSKDLEKGFYKMDRENFIKPETKTRLKGDFYIDKEGYVVYIDKVSAKEDSTELTTPEELQKPEELEDESIDEGLSFGLSGWN